MRDVTLEPGYTLADIQAALDSGEFCFADCYTLTASNGDKIRCTTAQNDMIVTPIGGGVKVQFTSKGVKVTGVKMVQGIGVDVDQQDARLDFTSTDTFQDLPMSMALLWGRFSGASLTRDRYFAARWGLGNEPTAWMGGTRIFSGRFGELQEVGRSYCKFQVNSNLMLLDVNMPKTLFQPGCKNVIYDIGCGLDRGLFQVDGLAASGSTQSVINWTGALASMKLGVFHMVVAAGVTLVRTIRDVNVGSQLLLSSPLEMDPTVGATFSTFQGCNRSYTRCGELGNQPKFRGYPFVPTEETAL